MSIQSEINRIKQDKEELRVALVNKGAILTGGALLSEFTTAVNSLEIGGGSDIDFEGVNVTADALLSGAVAINASGAKVTGNIETVTPTLTNNTFTVSKGYVASNYEKSVPEASITETDTTITVGVGYVATQRVFSKGGDIELPSVTVTASDLLPGVTALNSDGEVVTGTMKKTELSNSKFFVNYDTPGVSADFTTTAGYTESGDVLHASTNLPLASVDFDRTTATIKIGEGLSPERDYELGLALITETDTQVTIGVGYVNEEKTFTIAGNTELPAVNFESTDLRSGATALNSDGEVVTGNMPDAVVGTAHVGIQGSGNRAQVTVALMADAPGYLPGGYDRTIEVDAGAALGYTEYTPGAADITIPAETWLTDNQVIKGDANLLPANIKKDVTLFGVTGTLDASGSGGGSSGSFAKVTEYIAPHEAYSAVTSIAVSGFGEVEEGGEPVDYSAWNGTYNVTPATSTESSTEDRVFKHSTENKYLFRIYDSDNGEYYWVLNTSSSCDYAYEANFYSYNLASGTWFNYEYETSVSLTLTQNTAEYPAQELVLNAVSISRSSNGWSVGEAVTVSDFEKVPVKHGIYMLSGEKLIGGPLDYHIDDMYMPTDGLLMYFPMDDDGDVAVDVIGDLRLKKHGKSITSAGDCWQNTAWSPSCYLAGINTSFDLPEAFTLSAYVNYQGQEIWRYTTQVIDLGTAGDDSGFGIRVNRGDASTVDYGLRIGSDENGSHLTGIPANEWHQLTFTWIKNSDGNYDAKGYLDGVQKYSYTWDSYYTPMNSMKISMFGRRCFESTDNCTVCKIDEVMLWNRALSAEEIASLVQR